MKKAFFFYFLLPVFATAQTPKTVNVASKIEQVTVFFIGAQIERAASTPLSIGRSEIVFRGLTAQLDERSVQVSGDGEFTLLSVTQRTDFAANAAKDALDDLAKQQEVLTERIALEQNQLTVIQQEETILQRNQVQLVGVQNSTFKLDDLKQMIDFQRIRFNDLLNKRLEINKDLNNLSNKLQVVQLQMEEQRRSKTIAAKEVVVLVEAKTEATANFKLSYIVPNSRWTPTYDLRVRNLTDPLSMQMKASVTQASGEDWKDVKLTLSTGNPMENGAKPSIKTWFLQPIRPREIPVSYSVNQEMQGRVAGMETESVKDKKKPVAPPPHRHN